MGVLQLALAAGTFAFGFTFIECVVGVLVAIFLIAVAFKVLGR